MPATPLASRIPKVHLHCHLEGCLRPATFVELAAKHGVPLRYRPSQRDGSPWADAGEQPADPTDPYRFKDFGEFLLAFAAVGRSLRDPGDYARLAREFVADALAQNVMYGELFVSPSVWTFFNPELDVRAAFEAIVCELRAARPNARFKLIVDLTRNFGTEAGMRTARLAASLTDLDVVGVGLGGDEARFPATLFAGPYAFARAEGLRVVAHAGEAAGPQSVRDAIEVLGAERIGHGIQSLADPAVVELLASRGIPLEICPTSNVLTQTRVDGFDHHFTAFHDAGCIVTIDADDPPMFGTSIAREYELVERVAGPELLRKFVYNAVDASFATADEKRAMRARLGADSQPLRRSEGEHAGS